MPTPTDSWAQVELYRWQHGHLPGEKGTTEQPLNIPEALRGMAAAIEKGDRNNFPTPFNVAMVLKFAAAELERR
jgi:hypothetical protein